jgi:hypothetical protein
MDSLIISILDGFFFLIGKSLFWFCKKIGIRMPTFSHGGTVVTGFLVFIFLVMIVFFIAGEIYERNL